MRRSIQLIPLTAVCAATLAACGSANSSPHGRGTAQADGLTSLSAWRAAVVCARAHGLPNLADPVIGAHGNVIVPGVPANSIPPASVLSACSAQLRAINYRPPVAATRTPTDIAALVRVAVCMRRHGYPAWPDPDPQGDFHVRSADAGTPALFGRAVAACKSEFPASGWHLTVTPSGR